MAKLPLKPKTLRLSLVGAETLLGREIDEVLKQRTITASITPYAASGEGAFEEEDGEAIYRQALEAKLLNGEDAVLVAGSAAGAQKTYEAVKQAGGHPLVIDGTGELDQQPEARIVAPLLMEESGHSPSAHDTWLAVLAHPAASALALLLVRASSYQPVRRCVAQIFEPASERGKRGAAELHQQTTGLLSFKPIEKQIFDTQLGFSLLAAYGEEAPVKLAEVEQRIERQLATLLSRSPGQPIEMPSLRLVQAPVFHGYSISAWIEFEGNVEIEALRKELVSAQLEVRGPEVDPPSNVEATGTSGVMVGDARIDQNNARAVWLWMVADNLRLVADAAVDVVTQLGRRQ